MFPVLIAAMLAVALVSNNLYEAAAIRIVGTDPVSPETPPHWDHVAGAKQCAGAGLAR